MESSKFEFSAPQYIENLENAAVNSTEDTLDSFFNVPSTPKGQGSPKEVFMTPLDSVAITAKNALRSVTKSSKSERSYTRTSSALKDLTNIGKERNSIIFEGIKLISPLLGSSKKHQMKTRQDALNERESIDLRSRPIKRKTFSHANELPPSKYMSIAEAVYHFQIDTPPRFKSEKNKILKGVHTSLEKRKVTVPRTPVLYTKQRIRPIEIQSEETFSHIPKIHRLNPKIFDKPKPFVRTETALPKVPILPKSQPSKEEDKNKEEQHFVFKARPVPKSVLAPRPTILRVPKMEGENEKVVEISGGSVCGGIKLIHKRNIHSEMVISNKGGTSNKKTNHRNTLAPSGLNLTIDSTSSYSYKENMDQYRFRARPASVLHRKPFIPKKPEKTAIEVNEFHWATEKRLQDRHEFEKKLKEKEEKKEQNKTYLRKSVAPLHMRQDS